MQYLAGAVIMLAFFLCFLAGFYIGKENKNEHLAVSEEQQRKAEQLKKEFGEMLDYNLTKALQRKVVR